MLIFISYYPILMSNSIGYIGRPDRALSTCLGGSEAKWRGAKWTDGAFTEGKH